MTGLGSTSWLSAQLAAPLVGIQRRWPRTFHAITADAMPLATWGTARTVRSACGKRVAIAQYAGTVLLWPVQHRLPAGFARCAECWVATGRRRPRTRIEPPS